MGGAVSGIGGAVSSVIGGVGANKAAKQQVSSNNKAIDNQMAMYEKQLALLEPFRNAGQSGLAGLQSLAGNPIDRNQLLGDYFKSNEYTQLANQARYQQLAGSEATGGLGSTATSNGIASIAPELGQNYLNMKTAEQQDMYNQLLGLVNVGLSGAGGQASAASGNANALSSLYAQQGQIRGGKAAIPWQTAASANSSLSNGASQDVNGFLGMFGWGGGGSSF